MDSNHRANHRVTDILVISLTLFPRRSTSFNVASPLMQSVQCLGHIATTRCNLSELAFKGLVRIEFGHIVEVRNTAYTLTFGRDLFEKLMFQRLVRGDPLLRVQNEHFRDQIRFVPANIFAFTPRLKQCI